MGRGAEAMGASWRELLRDMPLCSSHSHHRPTAEQQALDLPALLANSYVGWGGTNPADRAAIVDGLATNTYFVWLSRAVAELYELGEIGADNWDLISETIAAAHAGPDHHWRILSDRCRLRFAVQDSYWSPGDDLGRPDLFKPTYRVNMWAMCPGPEFADHNGNSPWRDPAFAPATLEEYLERCEAAVEAAVAGGCVALKSALAYDRPVAFDNPELDAARRAFGRAAAAVRRADLLSFGDVVMHRLCALAGRLGVPLQVHLGVGILSGSRPMLFEPMIAAYPQTTFDLFHGGYPWTHEIGGLLHNYPNVIADFCWLPLLSTTTAVRALHEYLDVAFSSDRIVWGDDTWTSEEAFGARLAWEHVVAKVLAERVADGLCNTTQAERLAEKLMFANVERLFPS